MAGLAPLLVMLPAGRLIDRFGPRRLMIAGWWVGTVAAVVLALAPDWRWLLPGFFLYSVSSFAIPAMNAYVAQDARRNALEGDANRVMQMAVSSAFAAYLAGTIISPIISGWLGQMFGLRIVFWVSAVWFALSTLVVHSAPTEPVPNPEAAPILARKTPWWRFSAAQVRIYATLLLLFFFMGLGYALVPSYLEDVYGLPVSVIGGLGAATAVGGTFWFLFLGRQRSRPALLTATGLMTLALLGLLLGPIGAGALPVLIAVYFFLGTYMTVRATSLEVVGEHTPPQLQGTSFGMVETLFGLGMFLGPLAAGELYSREPHLPFLVTILALPLVMILIWLMIRSPRAGEAQGSAAPVPTGTTANAPDVPERPAAQQKPLDVDPTLCR